MNQAIDTDSDEPLVKRKKSCMKTVKSFFFYFLVEKVKENGGIREQIIKAAYEMR